MCQFFSLVSDGKGKIMYLDWLRRQEYLNHKREGSPDSHTSIADDYGYKGVLEDILNKYEYNPLTGIFTVDQINAKDDRQKVRRFCKKIDFKKIVPSLRIKPIFNPLKDRQCKRVTKTDIKLLKQWASVWTSVGAGVGASVWDSVWDSVEDSVRDSVRDSMWAYIGSFFIIKKWKYIKHPKDVYPFQANVDLWEKGLVPSFDGKVWRLHGGKDAKILFETK